MFEHRISQIKKLFLKKEALFFYVILFKSCIYETEKPPTFLFSLQPVTKTYILQPT